MTATRTTRPQTASAEIPPVPLTVEGYSVLHQMFRFRWQGLENLPKTGAVGMNLLGGAGMFAVSIYMIFMGY